MPAWTIVRLTTAAWQGKDNAIPGQIEAATKLAIDRQSMFHEDKEAADGLCRPKKEKKPKKDLDSTILDNGFSKIVYIQTRFL